MAPLLVLLVLFIAPMVLQQTAHHGKGSYWRLEFSRWLGSRCYWDELHSMLLVLPLLSSSYAVLARMLELGVLEWLGSTGLFLLSQRSQRAMLFLSYGLLSRHILLLLLSAMLIMLYNAA